MGRVAKSSKIMERMVNQNTYDDISQGNTHVVYTVLLVLENSVHSLWRQWFV